MIPNAQPVPTGEPSPIQIQSREQLDALIQRVDGLSELELDGLPLGMIQLDSQGKILKFNRTEASLARIKAKDQIGKSFFNEVAPCTRVREFYGRFQEGVRAKSLYQTFGFIFRFAHGARHVAITLFYSDKTDSVWVLVSDQQVPRDVPSPKDRLT
ncbi:PAS domain-containing protein [Corallococcus sp. CA053C]|uniref:PAS domain-containing protein n=1 Tax=Corallococcus sp. CA053C TaxID=2316732 RepID=UPI000EA30823|nr:PAS domain-containing protein [Corallococcus sp. CA053C]RKH13855.1 PAS domain-containing protein [Corallococcus sp. CA053C]